jgi:hypothetical protein
MNSSVQDLVNESKRNFYLFHEAPKRSLSWNDQLFAWGGWPLVIAFYGCLFVVAWVGFYLFLKKGTYK